MTTQRQIDRLTALRAAEWYELIRSGTRPAPREFMVWLETPAHMEAFMAIASDAPAVREAFKSGAFDLRSPGGKGSSQIIPLESLLAPREEHSTPHVSPPSKRRWPWIALAAGLAVLAIGASVTLSRGQTFDTRIGEQRILQLSDGSVIRLNARSSLDVRMGTDVRDIHLSGEALFKVAPDPRRPFRVHTRSATVQAIGTQFNVYERKDGPTLVTVLEGKVQVSAAETAPLALSAGEQVRVAAAGRVERAAIPDLEAATAWQQRQLVFKHTALEEMVAQFNRYNAVQLRLEDIPSQQFFYSGIFDADDPRALARLLEREPELRMEQGQREIVIRMR